MKMKESFVLSLIRLFKVPFSILTEYNIENFLDKKLKELGIKIDEDILHLNMSK